MRKIKSLVISSCKEFKSVRSIVLAAMFGAISLIINSFSIMIGQIVKIDFVFLPNEFVHYALGPIFGAVYGAVMDILNYFSKPQGAFFPGFTISAILIGILYGFILYKRPISLKRVIIANVIRVIFIDLVLNTYWLTLLMGKAYMVLLPTRIIEKLIMLPIETILLFTVIKSVEKTGVLDLLRPKKYKNESKAESN